MQYIGNTISESKLILIPLIVTDEKIQYIPVPFQSSHLTDTLMVYLKY